MLKVEEIESYVQHIGRAGHDQQIPYRGYITLGIIFANFAKGLISRKLLSVKFYVPWSRHVTSTARCTRDPSIAANTGLLNLFEASQRNVGGHQWPHKLWFLVLQTADMERGMCPIVVSSWSRLIKQLRHKDRERCLVPLYTEEFLPGLVSKYPCKCDGHVLLNRQWMRNYFSVNANHGSNHEILHLWNITPIRYLVHFFCMDLDLIDIVIKAC